MTPTVPVGLLTVPILTNLGMHLSRRTDAVSTDAAVLLDFMLEHNLVPPVFPMEPSKMYPAAKSHARRWEYHLAVDDEGSFRHRMLEWQAACLLACLETHLPDSPERVA